MTASLEEALKNVLARMEQAGFGINQEVRVAVDERLPFMGYTSRRWQSHVIVVSGFALKSPTLEGLLTHELSHVYRNITGHPSHSEPLITELMRRFIDNHKLDKNYEQGILHQVINHIQDLYADDVSVKVLTTRPTMALGLEQLGEFFLGWIKEDPSKSRAHQRDQWTNASMLLNNCFAVSNMERQKIAKSQIEKAKASNDRFLKQIKPNAAMRFGYFNRFMVGLEEEVSEAEFREQMWVAAAFLRFYQEVE